MGFWKVWLCFSFQVSSPYKLMQDRSWLKFQNHQAFYPFADVNVIKIYNYCNSIRIWYFKSSYWYCYFQMEELKRWARNKEQGFRSNKDRGLNHSLEICEYLPPLFLINLFLHLKIKTEGNLKAVQVWVLRFQLKKKKRKETTPPKKKPTSVLNHFQFEEPKKKKKINIFRELYYTFHYILKQSQ